MGYLVETSYSADIYRIVASLGNLHFISKLFETVEVLRFPSSPLVSGFFLGFEGLGLSRGAGLEGGDPFRALSGCLVGFDAGSGFEDATLTGVSSTSRFNIFGSAALLTGLGSATYYPELSLPGLPLGNCLFEGLETLRSTYRMASLPSVSC